MKFISRNDQFVVSFKMLVNGVWVVASKTVLAKDCMTALLDINDPTIEIIGVTRL